VFVYKLSSLNLTPELFIATDLSVERVLLVSGSNHFYNTCTLFTQDWYVDW